VRRVIAQIGNWFDQRLQLAAPIREVAEHPVPRSTASWFYVFGSAALVVFLMQLVTGILLAFVYVPSAADAGVVRSVNRRLGTGLTTGQGADRFLSDRALETSRPGVSLRFVLRYRCCARTEQAGEGAATEAQSISRYGKNGDGGGVHGS